MPVLKFTGKDLRTTYKCFPFEDGMKWLKGLSIVGFDTETNVVDSILQRELKVTAIADENGDFVWVIQWEYLSQIQQKEYVLELKKKLAIIHNVAFDYQVMKKSGVVLEKVYCTYLAEQTLTTGLSKESGYHGLQAVFKRRFDIDISKDEQLSFGDSDFYSDRQIQYAAVDVVKLGLLRRIQRKEMKANDKRIGQEYHKGMRKSLWWDTEFVKAVGDMESTGVRIEREKWYAIEDAIKPIYDAELILLNDLVKEELFDILLENEMVSETDDIVVNVVNSSAKKVEVLTHVYSFPIVKTSQVELKKLLQENDPNFPLGLKLSGKAWESSDYPRDFSDNFSLIKMLILYSKNKESVTTAFNRFLMYNLRDFAHSKGWLRKAGELTLNWASPVQRLIIFQGINPSIPSTGKDVIIDYINESSIIAHYLQWNEVAYQIKMFGRNFFDKHVEVDGKFRTRFNIILATGRLSSIEPNLLNIPRKVAVFREAIIPDLGYDLLDADYDGQELVITTALSKEPSWTEYLRLGYDLHSKNSELIFGKRWEDATEEGCAYYAIDPKTGTPAYKKCSCAGHIEMRDQSKMVSFGSIYGITFMALAAKLKISEKEAKFILKRFFEIVPYIEQMMQRFGNYAIEYGHIIEPVFGRVRFFDQWKLSVPEEHAAIRRAAFNTPIQSSGSAILKIAFVLLRRWINHNNLQDKVQLLLPYHDETIAQSTPEYTEVAKAAIEHYMMLAAKLAHFDVKAGAKSGKNWAEAH